MTLTNKNAKKKKRTTNPTTEIANTMTNPDGTVTRRRRPGPPPAPTPRPAPRRCHRTGTLAARHP